MVRYRVLMFFFKLIYQKFIIRVRGSILRDGVFFHNIFIDNIYNNIRFINILQNK